MVKSGYAVMIKLENELFNNFLISTVKYFKISKGKKPQDPSSYSKNYKKPR